MLLVFSFSSYSLKKSTIIFSFSVDLMASFTIIFKSSILLAEKSVFLDNFNSSRIYKILKEKEDLLSLWYKYWIIYFSFRDSSLSLKLSITFLLRFKTIWSKNRREGIKLLPITELTVWIAKWHNLLGKFSKHKSFDIFTESFYFCELSANFKHS